MLFAENPISQAVNSADPTMKVHVSVPDYVSATGGIQALSRFLARALRECLPDAEIVVLSKNDRSVPDPGENTVTQFSAVGWWAPSQRTAAFTINLLRWAVRERPDLIVATHVNFTPAAPLAEKVMGNSLHCAGSRRGGLANSKRSGAARPPKRRSIASRK